MDGDNLKVELRTKGCAAGDRGDMRVVDLDDSLEWQGVHSSLLGSIDCGKFETT
jgi:hypothetical protein